MPTLIRYPLDPTGTSPNNYVQGEEHTLLRRKVRAVAPTYGAFFTESMQVYDVDNGRPLDKGIDYDTVELYELPTVQFGKEVHAVVLIKNENVGDNITLSYQVVGGEYSASASAIIHMIDTLALDNRPVDWGDLIAKPTEFEPSEHLHDAGDLYGFEYVTNALERVARAVVQGDHVSHDAIYRYIDQALAKIQPGLLKSEVEEIADFAVSSAMQDYIATLANTAASNIRLMQDHITTRNQLAQMSFNYDILMTSLSKVGLNNMTADINLKFRVDALEQLVKQLQAQVNS